MLPKFLKKKVQMHGLNTQQKNYYLKDLNALNAVKIIFVKKMISWTFGLTQA